MTSHRARPKPKGEGAPPVADAPLPEGPVPVPPSEGSDPVAAIREALSRPRPRNSPPTMTSYSQGLYRRYFVLDVDGDSYRRAWEAYKEASGKADAVAFLDIVYHVLGNEIPRMHREVSWVPLDRCGRKRPFIKRPPDAPAMTDGTGRTPTYCTPDDVAETLGLSDAIDPSLMFSFSDSSVPTYRRVESMILSAEDEIDRRTHRSWRENRVIGRDLTVRTPQWDENAWRNAYYLQGGYCMQLRRDVRPWDPALGDRLMLRGRDGSWTDVSDGCEDIGGNVFSFDHPEGRLYLRARIGEPRYRGVRISYRYGSDEPVPAAISRLCALMVAEQVLVMDFYSVKVGSGGDISGYRDQALARWDSEIGRILTAYQSAGPVHSLYR